MADFLTEPRGADVRPQERYRRLVLEVGQVQRRPVLHQNRYRRVVLRYDGPVQGRITVQVVGERVRRT